MVSAGLGNELRTVFWRSRDLVTWEDSGFAVNRNTHPGMVMLSFDTVGEYVYIFGTHGLRRDGPIWMWRCPVAQFPQGVWEPRNGGRPIREGRHGELCFRFMQGNAVLSFFDERRYCQSVLTQASPEGDWSKAALLDYAWGDRTPQLYGGYISPTSELNKPNGMKFWVSQWVTATNDPYHVLSVQATLQALGPVVKDTEYHGSVDPRVSVLADAMLNSLPLDRYAALLPAVMQCLAESDCNTSDRVAMWCAQVGHESGGLRYMQELASGSAYEGRADLGNVQRGDGPRFKGHGPIQVTGRHNHAKCSEWAFGRGLVPSPTFFVDYPEQLASDKYGFLGVTWYWTTQRPMNEAADARDLDRATRFVNGGLNGIDDRRKRYNNCLKMGDRLMTLVGHRPVGERVLAFNSAITAQETGYWCGPASAQIILAIQGINVPESVLAIECGTHQGGTDTVLLIERCLDTRLPQANYTSVMMPNDPPTKAQKDLMWRHLTQSIDAGYGVILNIVAPPNNYPRGVKGSPNLAYRGGTVFHYVACVGYDDTPPRSVRLADPGFPPFHTWISFDQCATLVPPKGYIYANAAAKPVAPPPVAPPQPPPQPVLVIRSTLAGRPKPHTQPADIAETLLDMRAEQLITQALVFALADKMGIDAKAVYAKAKESFNA
jgi:predicted chitinase